jgi:hypothetical protein
MPRLLVEIGGDRFHAEIAHVNDPTRPTEIDTYVRGSHERSPPSSTLRVLIAAVVPGLQGSVCRPSARSRARLQWVRQGLRDQDD